MAATRFKFDIDFQWQILKYTIKDKHGYKALFLYKPEYFTVIDQQIIAKGLHRFFKRKHRVPATSSVMNEELNQLFKTKDYAQSLLEEDRARIKRKCKRLYKGILKEGDEILHKCRLFASYIEFKKSLEDVDLENFSQYEVYSKKFQKAINLGMEVDEKKGRFLVAGHRSRITERYNTEDIIPTPFRQINSLTNAGGYNKGSVIVVVDRPKKGKTLFLANVTAAYIKKKGNNTKVNGLYKGKQRAAKKVAYFDLENGETAIEIRLDQCLINKTKMEVLSHEYDDRLKKLYRQFRRFEGEVYIRRMPSGTTANDIQKVLDDTYTEYGIRFEDVIVDYAALMAANSGAKDDFQRISDVYLDLKNLAEKNNLDTLWTANHVKREAYKRRLTVYEPDDLAKCIDIERHVDAIWGLQQSKLEEANNVWRLELIEQRDGLSFGRALFWGDLKTQRLVEFTKEEEIRYNQELEKLGDQGENRKETAQEKQSRVKKAREQDL